MTGKGMGDICKFYVYVPLSKDLGDRTPVPHGGYTYACKFVAVLCCTLRVFRVVNFPEI